MLAHARLPCEPNANTDVQCGIVRYLLLAAILFLFFHRALASWDHWDGGVPTSSAVTAPTGYPPDQGATLMPTRAQDRGQPRLAGPYSPQLMFPDVLKSWAKAVHVVPLSNLPWAGVEPKLARHRTWKHWKSNAECMQATGRSTDSWPAAAHEIATVDRWRDHDGRSSELLL